MNKMKGLEAGFDFYLHHKGNKILDDALYFILKNLKDKNIDREFLEFCEDSLFSKKLNDLVEFLEEPADLSANGLTAPILELMEKFENERKGVERYLAYGRSPALTVDGIVFNEGKLLLIRRKNEPFKGMYALPGGFVDYGEKTEDAVVREIFEETGLVSSVQSLMGVYSNPERDPRGHTASAIYLMKIEGGELKEGDDAIGVEYVDPDNLPRLAFDHEEVVQDAMALVGG